LRTPSWPLITAVLRTRALVKKMNRVVADLGIHQFFAAYNSVISSSMSASDSISSAGDYDDRGTLNSFERKGFIPEWCLLELIGNSLDAIDAVPADRGQISISVDPDITYIADNGKGMNRMEAKNMWSLQKENHAGQKSRGVSGVGAKPSLSILSEKQNMKILTMKAECDPLAIDVPWAKMHADGLYKGMVKIRPMTEEEFDLYSSKLGEGASGTILCIPTNDALIKGAERCLGFSGESVSPLHRAGIVYGRDAPPILYSHFEDTSDPQPVVKFDYFKGSDSDFYKGVRRDSIEVWVDSRGKYRFIGVDSKGAKWECRPQGTGCKLLPEPLNTSLHGWNHVETLDAITGLRRDPVIFEDAKPILPGSSEKIDEYIKTIVGEEHRDFNTRTKFVRNLQTIGTIPIPDVKESNARADGKSYLTLRLVQQELHAYPISSQKNHLDKITNTQENKNQHNGESLPTSLTRLLRFFRKEKADEIWSYMEKKCSRGDKKQKRALDAAVLAAALITAEADSGSDGSRSVTPPTAVPLPEGPVANEVHILPPSPPPAVDVDVDGEGDGAPAVEAPEPPALFIHPAAPEPAALLVAPEPRHSIRAELRAKLVELLASVDAGVLSEEACVRHYDALRGVADF
jgi:hypothetical protein